MKKDRLFEDKGMAGDVLTGMLEDHKAGDAHWRGGRTFGFVFHPGERYAYLAEAYRAAFQYESTLNPSAFPSLRNFEKEVIGMAGELMHGDGHVAGSVTTGGTESIFLALSVAREEARERFGKDVQGEVIIPETAHPAFLKACFYLSLKPVVVKAEVDGKANVKAVQEAIRAHTILIAVSAPCFPYGVVDPVAAVGKIASKHQILMHVDACMGGFMLPFLEDLGYDVPGFDFRVKGVTSISLDAHKYGYAPKGTSIILYRSRKLRKKQFFIHTEWPGGIFASTTFMGTKGGGPVAGCWAMMKHLGRKGYQEIAREVMKTSQAIKVGIEGFSSLEVIGNPHMSLLAFSSKDGNIFNIGDAMQRKGWHLDRLQFPEALHLTVTRLNVGKEEAFLKDLAEVVSEKRELIKECRVTQTSIHIAGKLTSLFPSIVVDKITRWAGRQMSQTGGSSRIPQAALYGLSASITNRRNIRKLILNLLDGMY